jgi:AraC-like DNA-binding protein
LPAPKQLLSCHQGFAMSFASSHQVPHMRFDSRAISPQAALDQWRGNLSRSWDMSLADAAEAPNFIAEVSMWKMDDLLVGTGTFGPTQTRMRRERNIRCDQLDHYRVLLMRSGRFDCDADGRQVSLAPGRFVVTDMALPESSESACSTAILYIPRERLEEALPRAARLHGASPDNACADILAGHLSALLQELPEAAPEAIPGLSQATVNLVAASLAESPENREAARPAIEKVLLRRARKHVEDHLHDEGLSAEQLYTQLRISRSTLYRLFEALGGVAQYVKERRLARVHEILSRSTERQHIGRLAEQHGFKSAAHFSKAFREQFGYSAREVPQVRAAAPGAAGERLDRWLSTLCH